MLMRARRKDDGHETKLDAEEGDSGAEGEVSGKEGGEEEGAGCG